tara:strand:- start:1600 stop:2625 length:1026 start_codon:yes stop_codon:yes gene_type:complete
MSGGSKTTYTKTEPWDAQKDYLTKGFDYTEQLYKGGSLNPEYFPGETVAGFDPASISAQDAIVNYATDPYTNALMGTARDRLGGMLDYSGSAMGYGEGAARPLSTSEYGALTPFGGMGQDGISMYEDLIAGEVNTDVFGPLADAYRQEAMGQLTGEVLPGIRTAITQNQAGGGTRGDILQANATAAAQQRISDNLAKAEFSAYQQAQDRRMQAAQMGMTGQQAAMGYGMQGAGVGEGALGQYPTTLTAPVTLAGALGGVGEQRQAQDQADLDAARQAYAYNIQRGQIGLQNYLAGISGEFGGSTSTTGPAGPNPMLTALAGGLGFAAGGPLGAGLASLIKP